MVLKGTLAGRKEDYDHGSMVDAAEELGLHGDENDMAQTTLGIIGKEFLNFTLAASFTGLFGDD